MSGLPPLEARRRCSGWHGIERACLGRPHTIGAVESIGAVGRFGCTMVGRRAGCGRAWLWAGWLWAGLAVGGFWLWEGLGVGGLGCWRAWVWEGLAVGSFCEGMAALESGGGWYVWGARSHMHALVHTCHGGWDLLGRRRHAWLGLTAPDTSRVPLQATRWLDEERVHACLPCRTRAAESWGVSSPHRWQDPGRTQNPRHDSRIAKVTAVSQGAKAVLSRTSYSCTRGCGRAVLYQGRRT